MALSAGTALAQADTVDGKTVIVPDDKPSWTINGQFYIRNGGKLIVKNNGKVEIKQDISIGRNGSGSLTIEDGGRVDSVHAYLGYSHNSEGHVTVSGPSAMWSSTRSVLVGREGIGSLTIENGGTVSNSNSNSGSNPDGYRASIGDLEGSEGTVIVTGLGSTWINHRRLFVGNKGSGTLTISDGGVVRVGSIYTVTIANAATAEGTLNIGAAADDGPAAPGVLENTNVKFGDGKGTLTFNHTGTDYEFGSSLVSTQSGTHAINHLAGTTILTGDSSGFAGMTTVSGGTLVVNNALGGSAVIENGGRLAGSGTIGSGGSTVTLASGGTIAPGNSIGTLTVDGDLIFDAGSTYEVEVDPGGTDSDLIAVTGSATLGGSVVHIGMTGNYAPTSTYTILTAANGVTGTFSDVSSDFAFLDPILGYGDNDVTLTLQRNDIDFTEVGQTRNQIATAASLNALTFGNALYDAVVQTDEGTARAAFDQLSGELHASVKTGLIEDSRHIRNAANDRLRMGSVNSVPAGHHRGLAAWGTAFGSWGHSDGDGNAATLDRSTAGFVAGVDGRIDDAWRIGFLTGYSRSSFDVDDRRSAADSDNYHLGLYSGTEWGALALRGGLAYTWHDLETSRTVAFTGFADKLTASYDAGTFQGFGEVGYRIHTGMVSLEPFANLAYVDLRTDAFTERGGAAALASTSQSTDVTFSVIGLRAETELAFGATRATLRGKAGWQHAFGDTLPLSTHAFAGSNAFTIAGAPIAEDAVVLEGGLDLDIGHDAMLGVSYRGQFGSDVRDNGFDARLNLKF